MFRAAPLTALVLGLAVLAGCGADGPPEPPTKAATAPGLTLTGEARIGLVKGED